MLDTYIAGFYFPSALALIAFIRLLTTKETYHHHSMYGVWYLVSLLFALQLPILGVGGWVITEGGYNQIKFLSVFPLAIMCLLWRHYRQHRTLPKLSVPWICLGSFSSSLAADTLMAYTAFDDFTFTGIGGAGLLDGLVLITLFPALSAYLLNCIADKQFARSNA